MFSVDRQVHGYRQGHQLLATSRALPKADQTLVDRLSDVAGPLRPKERFEPYLSAYPLPSGEHYVLAKTWQDTVVARAGCVRTLSLIVLTSQWATLPSPAVLLPLLDVDGLPSETDATSLMVDESASIVLPPTPRFRASELLEALFLEETHPVVVFDAPDPELIAVRLLTALWPNVRRRFAVSTFALSPRKVSGRDFDLIFAPKDARAKFTDWNGRRVDGQSNQDARHKWTGRIVGRVFERPHPQLLTDREIGLVGGRKGDGDSAAALRIAVLWDELLGKLETTPTAALGLLDIAKSGMVESGLALNTLEPALASAIRHASESLPVTEAWDFLSAIVRKIQGLSMLEGEDAASETAKSLAARSPESGISLLSQADEKGALSGLVPSIADGLAMAPAGQTERALALAPADVLGRLVASEERLAARAAKDIAIVERLSETLLQLDPETFGAAGRHLLPYLIEDWQFEAAKPVIDELDGPSLVEEVGRLGRANGFAGKRLGALVVERARHIGARDVVRDALARSSETSGRDALLDYALEPGAADFAWLTNSSGLPASTVDELALSLIGRASDPQLSQILSNPATSGEAVQLIVGHGGDLLQRAIFSNALPTEAFVPCVMAALPVVDTATQYRIAEFALQRCFPISFGGDEIATLTALLGVFDGNLNGAWAALTALSRDIPSPIASRNMQALQAAPQRARAAVVGAIADVADTLVNRRTIDLNAQGIGACVALMLDAERTAYHSLLAAAGKLLPTLMRQTRDPVSPMIATLFPVLYRELAKEDEGPDLLKFIPFFDWDRCKAARQELVSAFVVAAWPPSDLALTACRCGDVPRILRRTAKSNDGEEYIQRVFGDLKALPEKCRNSTERTILALKKDWPSPYDWRD